MNRGISDLISDLRWLFINRHRYPESRKSKLAICKGLVRAIRKLRKDDGLLF